jgi:hypothetical protein
MAVGVQMYLGTRLIVEDFLSAGWLVARAWVIFITY